MIKLLTVTTVSATLRAFLQPFARHFRAKGWRVDAMAADALACPECLESFDRIWDVELSRNPADVSNLLRASKNIREIVGREGYDLVHVHTPVASFITRYALRGLRKKGDLKVIYTAHGFHFLQNSTGLKNGVFLSLEKLAGGWTDYLVVINREDEEAARRHLLVLPDKLIYMPGIGIDTERYSKDCVQGSEIESVRSELGLKPDQPLFLMTAEFIPRKRHADALSAFARLNNPVANLAIAGDGPLMDEMRAMSRSLGIADQVHFLGLRNDIPVLIRAAVATILPSLQEGLPRSVMESLSLEVPAIGSNIRGTRELLGDGCGLLVNPRDIDGFKNAMAWILDNPDEAHAMGQRGRKKMQELFDLKLVIREHERLYDRALGVSDALTSS